jgi:hypothetical protein
MNRSLKATEQELAHIASVADGPVVVLEVAFAYCTFVEEVNFAACYY